MVTPETVSGMIASIVHSTRYASPVWAAMPEEEREQIMAHWAELIRQDPDGAADRIIDDILARPGLGEAWDKLHEIGPLAVRPNSIRHLVTLVGP